MTGAARALLAVLLALLLAVPAAAQDFPQLTGRVVDQANLLSPEQEAALTQKLEALQQATSRQLVIVTVPTIGDMTIEDYGYQIGRHWQIGQSEANNGVLLIIALNERKVRIEVGYGLGGILTDALSSQIIRDDIVPHFHDNDYAGGIEAGTDAIIAQLQAPPEQAEQRALAAQQAQQQQRERGGSIAPILFWVGVILVILFISAASRGGGQRYRRDVSVWGPGTPYRHDNAGSDIGWFLLGMALNSLGNSGRHGGGGSSWGGGGGGGGGGFSGGGGSFGGGGASGGW
ncbi:hypothetical protein GCM10023232_25290 [Sphingosinicella ginsenosidimutans]|uniref:TPM domain-containing protein n=1 Tax=Allosphingosinicella ginsenosidimutans TaxID=1176539 RepID=UPI001863D08D|nr:TPM domain-containing protein [Sphingosinicella ginsenosidimutans]